MRVKFTKMQGAGNDFVVLDATREPLQLSPAQLKRLGDRRFGVGADQILVVERPRRDDVDFAYRIFNNTGDEVEHCGNGARCFVRYVREHGLTQRDTIRVETVNNLLELRAHADGRVSVDMNAPIFQHERIPFDASGLVSQRMGDFDLWPLQLGSALNGVDRRVNVAVLSMGNPHAVQRVGDVREAPVAELGPLVEKHARFPRKVNAGFMQVVARNQIALRVFERDAGETLACGTGACAAVVAGIRLGWLDRRVDVHTRGGVLTVEWPADAVGGHGAPLQAVGALGAHVLMTGPAETVFEGEINL